MIRQVPLTILAVALSAAPTGAQEVGPALDPGAMAGWTAGAAVQHDLDRRAGRAKGRRSRPQSVYERWRNRPGKRDCGAYNWKCPAKPRTIR